MGMRFQRMVLYGFSGTYEECCPVLNKITDTENEATDAEMSKKSGQKGMPNIHGCNLC